MSKDPLKIWKMDTRADNPDRIVYIYEALKKLFLSSDFKILDIACGRATILDGLVRLFPDCIATGVDIDEFPEWKNISKKIKMVKLPFQEFIGTNNESYDVVMMLNSYRNFGSGEYFKEKLNKWLFEHTKYFIASEARLPFKRLEISGIDHKNHKLELYEFSK